MINKLWIISELYYPEITSTGYILTQIAEGLATKGFSVSVLCSQPTYSVRGMRAPAKENRNRVMIHRSWGTTLDKNILFFRLINLVTITLSIFVNSIWRLRRFDSVLVVTNPPSLPYFVALACRLRGASCVLLIHDLYPELLVATGKLSSTSIFVRLMNRINKLLYSSVQHIVVIGRDMRAQIANKVGNKKLVSVITNWADIDSVIPASKEHNALIKERHLKARFILEYAGNMGYPNDIESIVESAAQLSEDSGICFLFIGSGYKKKWLEQEVTRRNLSNVVILPSRPRDDQVNFLNACDIALVSLVQGMKGVSVPSRTYNILAAGKPIIAIAAPESEVALMVEEDNIGWIVPPNNHKELVKVIREAYSNPKRLTEMGMRARAIAETKYGFDHSLNAFQKLFNDLYVNIK
jgi:colanic acid biosynthesis glycosyl transferase WcaI